VQEFGQFGGFFFGVVESEKGAERHGLRQPFEAELVACTLLTPKGDDANGVELTQLERCVRGASSGETHTKWSGVRSEINQDTVLDEQDAIAARKKPGDKTTIAA